MAIVLHCSCGRKLQIRDEFAGQEGKCPACGAWYLETACPYCRSQHHIDQWFAQQSDEEVLDPIVVPAAPEKGPP